MLMAEMEKSFHDMLITNMQVLASIGNRPTHLIMLLGFLPLLIHKYCSLSPTLLYFGNK